MCVCVCVSFLFCLSVLPTTSLKYFKLSTYFMITAFYLHTHFIMFSCWVLYLSFLISQFYLILNVAVGGVNGYFPDAAQNPGGKPWSNTSPQVHIQTLQPVHVSTMLQKCVALMLDACEWLLWHPTHFTATDTAPSTHCKWVGCAAFLFVWKGRNKSPYCEMNSVHSACNGANQAVLQLFCIVIIGDLACVYS